MLEEHSRIWEGLLEEYSRIWEPCWEESGPIFQHDRSFLLSEWCVQGPLIETTALLKELTHDFASQCQVSPTASVLHGGK